MLYNSIGYMYTYLAGKNVSDFHDFFIDLVGTNFSRIIASNLTTTKFVELCIAEFQ